MRSTNLFTALLVLALAVFPTACSKKGDQKKESAPSAVALPQQGFAGWNSLTLETAYVKLDVVPELGGKIMGYNLRGTQILWHDAKKEGYIEKEQGYGYGQKFFNPGGAKVWPAPQGWSGKNEWPGPPDNVLDGSPYEGSRSDSLITVTGPKDTGEGRTGLQYKHSYSLTPYSSIVNLNLTMTNVTDRPVTWSLWHLATVPADSGTTAYVPANKGDWKVIFGDKANPQWKDAQNGVFSATYEKKVGKVGMKVREGWAAWYDASEGIAFVLRFPAQKGAQYPDGGSQFEIWSSGAGTVHANNQDTTSEYNPDASYMELEVMGPLVKLNPGQTSALDVSWASCRCSGVQKVSPGGVAAEALALKDGQITAKFGVFYGGFLQVVYLDKSGKQIGLKNVGEVSPLTEITVSTPLSEIASYAKGIRYQVQSYDKKTVCKLDELKF